MEGHGPGVNSDLRSRLSKLVALQASVPNQPYSIVLRLKLATAYKRLVYPDLAAGDAYKALLLIDELVEEGEYHSEALDAAKSDIVTGQSQQLSTELHEDQLNFNHFECCCSSPSEDSDNDQAVTWAKACWSRTAYAIFVECLIDCGCLRSAFDHNARALKSFHPDSLFESYQETILLKLRSHFESRDEDFGTISILNYPDKGLARRELYPWNEFEPDRYSSETVQLLNAEMSNVAPKLEVRMVELPILSHRTATSSEPSPADNPTRYIKQLGVFAKEDVAPGETILQEKSLLTAISRLHESYCDACSISLSRTDGTADQRSCDDCEEVFFCSEECRELAQERYHPALCGVNTERKVPASEAADSLYTLLLVRALALAEAQGLHPLELKEVRYIWGDYHGLDLDHEWKMDSIGQPVDPFGSVPQTLPFSFNGNILTPLHMLEKMGVNIFEQSPRYDTWVFNTLYAKFRGTASAQQGLDGRPEIGAVHPMWCLANHSCDPNVAWKWEGSIKFWTREQLIDWKGRDPKVKPGLRKGEEVLSHYCDIRLPVKERREWAVGALGGDCMCTRCVWEEAEERRGGKP